MRCVLCRSRGSAAQGNSIACGEWPGQLTETPRGQEAFGYHPLFLVTELEQTAAEIPSELKNMLSHRGNAFRQLLDKLRAEAA